MSSTNWDPTQTGTQNRIFQSRWAVSNASRNSSPPNQRRPLYWVPARQTPDDQHIAIACLCCERVVTFTTPVNIALELGAPFDRDDTFLPTFCNLCVDAYGEIPRKDGDPPNKWRISVGYPPHASYPYGNPYFAETSTLRAWDVYQYFHRHLGVKIAGKPTEDYASEYPVALLKPSRRALYHMSAWWVRPQLPARWEFPQATRQGMGVPNRSPETGGLRFMKPVHHLGTFNRFFEVLDGTALPINR